MQKNSKKASILIWAIFLSLIISLSFLSISTKITKNLKENSKNNINIIEQNKIENILKNSDLNIENVWNKSIHIENKNLKKSLKKSEEYEISFNTNSIININLTSSWVIYYELNWTKTGSWVLTWTLNNYETWSWILKLINFSWYISFELVSDNKFEIPEKKYKIIEHIWSKNIIKTRGIIK